MSAGRRPAVIMGRQRTLWAAAWVAAIVGFVAGFVWLLAEQSDRAYWLSIPLTLPLIGLVAARRPAIVLGVPRLLAWALAIPLWAGWAGWLLITQSRTVWILGLYACLPLIALLYERYGEPAESGESGAEIGGPPA